MLSDTVTFSPTVLTMCSMCSHSHSLSRTPLEWLKETIHDKLSSYVSFAQVVVFDSGVMYVFVVWRHVKDVVKGEALNST